MPSYRIILGTFNDGKQVRFPGELVELSEEDGARFIKQGKVVAEDAAPNPLYFLEVEVCQPFTQEGQKYLEGQELWTTRNSAALWVAEGKVKPLIRQDSHPAGLSPNQLAISDALRHYIDCFPGIEAFIRRSGQQIVLARQIPVRKMKGPQSWDDVVASELVLAGGEARGLARYLPTSFVSVAGRPSVDVPGVFNLERDCFRWLGRTAILRFFQHLQNGELQAHGIPASRPTSRRRVAIEPGWWSTDVILESQYDTLRELTGDQPNKGDPRFRDIVVRPATSIATLVHRHRGDGKKELRSLPAAKSTGGRSTFRLRVIEIFEHLLEGGGLDQAQTKAEIYRLVREGLRNRDGLAEPDLPSEKAISRHLKLPIEDFFADKS